MDILATAALAGVVINFSVFIVGGKMLFDSSRPQKTFSAFVVAYSLLFVLTTTFQYFSPVVSGGRNGASVAALILSLALFGKTVATTIRNPFAVIFSEGAPTQLVTHGPYNFVRHPFYTSYLVTFFASALASNHWVPSFCSVAAVGIYYNAARAEEKRFLASHLGPTYAAFQRRTGMFWPILFGKEKNELQR